MNYEQFLASIERLRPLQEERAKAKQKEIDAYFDEISPHLVHVGVPHRIARPGPHPID
ncbi:hypothetical protein OIU34_21725 [Pararhizobium sp. BT-229]|uniref:hypothetical protein n=1 Tax=Pararhizobium sp. BT-229 TaxID=2986923 RepID=UPI0021F74DC7|nr:hypothetical protein [Pararhizobium sp. BT-229]MCV9964513.1 hypothetical protein [Pararhizobium sp. BT-229]